MTFNILYGTLDKARKSSQVFFRSSISTTCVPEEYVKRRLGLIQNKFKYCKKSNFADSHRPASAFCFQEKYLHNTVCSVFCFKEEQGKDQTNRQDALLNHSEKPICQNLPKPSGNDKLAELQLYKENEKEEKKNTTYVNPRLNTISRHQNLVWAKRSTKEKCSPNENVGSGFLNKTVNEANGKIEKWHLNNKPYASDKNKENQNGEIDMNFHNSKNILTIDILPNCKDVSNTTTQSIQFKTINDHNKKQNHTSNIMNIPQKEYAKKLNTSKEISFNSIQNNIKDNAKTNKLISTNSKKQHSISNEKVNLTENINHSLASAKSLSKLNDQFIIEVNQIPPKNRTNNDLLKEVQDLNNRLNINPKLIKKEKIDLNSTYKGHMDYNVVWPPLHSKRKLQMNDLKKKNENTLENKINIYYKNIDLKQKSKSATSINSILRPAKPKGQVNKYQSFKKQIGSLTAPLDHLSKNIREVVRYSSHQQQRGEPITNPKLMQMIGTSFPNNPLPIFNNYNFNSQSNTTGDLTVDRNKLKKKLSLSNSNIKDLTMELKSEIKNWEMYHKLKQTAQESTSELYKTIMNQRKVSKPTKKNVPPRKKEKKKCTVISIPLKPHPAFNKQFQKTIHTAIKLNPQNCNNIQLSKSDPTDVMMNKYNKRRIRNCKNTFNDIVKKNKFSIFGTTFVKKETTELEGNRLIEKEVQTKNNSKGKINKRAKSKNEYLKKAGEKHLRILLKNSKKTNLEDKVHMVRYIHHMNPDDKMDSSKIKEINTYPSGYLKRPEFIIQLIPLNENEHEIVVKKSEEKDTDFNAKKSLENQAHDKSDEVSNKNVNKIVDKSYEKVEILAIDESKYKPVELAKTDYQEEECENIRESTSKSSEDMIKKLEMELDGIKNSHIRKIRSFINEQVGPCKPKPQRKLTTSKSYHKFSNSPLDGEHRLSYEITDEDEDLVKSKDNNINQSNKPKKLIKVCSSAADDSEQTVNTALQRHNKENISEPFQDEKSVPNHKVSIPIQKYFENKNNLFKGSIPNNGEKNTFSIHHTDNLQFEKSIKSTEKDDQIASKHENKKNEINLHVISNISYEENRIPNISIIQQLPKQTTTTAVFDKQNQPTVRIYNQQIDPLQMSPFTSHQKESTQAVSLEEAKLNLTKQHVGQTTPNNMAAVASNPLLTEVTNVVPTKHQKTASVTNIPTTNHQMKASVKDNQVSSKIVPNTPEQHLELFNKQIQTQRREKEQPTLATPATTESNTKIKNRDQTINVPHLTGEQKFNSPSYYLNEVTKKINNFWGEGNSNDKKTCELFGTKQLVEERKSEMKHISDNKNLFRSNTLKKTHSIQSDYSRNTISKGNVNHMNLIEQIIQNKESENPSKPLMTLLNEKLGFESINATQKESKLKTSEKKSSPVVLNLNINKELLNNIKTFYCSMCSYLKLTNTSEKEQSKTHKMISADDLLDNALKKNKSYSLTEERKILDVQDKTPGMDKNQSKILEQNKSDFYQQWTNQMVENGIKKSLSDDLNKYSSDNSEYKRKLLNLLPKQSKDHLLPSQEKLKQPVLNKISTTDDIPTAELSQSFHKQALPRCENILSKKKSRTNLLNNKTNEKEIENFSGNQVKHQRTFCNLNNFENPYIKLYRKDSLSWQQKKWDKFTDKPKIITKKSKAIFDCDDDKTLFNQFPKFLDIKSEKNASCGMPPFRWKGEARLHVMKKSKIKNHHKLISSNDSEKLSLMATLNSLKNTECSTKFGDYYNPESYWLDYNPHNFFNASKKLNNDYIKYMKKRKHRRTSHRK